MGGVSILNRLAFDDFLGRSIPDRDALVEIGEIGQVASDAGVISEDFILHNRLARSHRVEEICLVIHCVTVASRHSVAFPFILDL